MRRIVCLIGALCVPVIANATVKCIALNETTHCERSETNDEKGDWAANCDGGITVRGVSLPKKGTDSYCFCKMVSPAVSDWVETEVGDNDTAMCAFFCGFYFSNEATFGFRPVRKDILSSLI